MKLVLVAIMTAATAALLACGSGDRVGETVSRYDLQVGDCYNSSDSVDEILLIECREANRVVLATFDLEGSEYPGSEQLQTDVSRRCSEETNAESDKHFRPDGNTWSLGDRTVVCLKEQSGGTTTTSDQGDKDDPPQEGGSPEDSRPSEPGFDSGALSGRWDIVGAAGYFVLTLSRDYEDGDGKVSVYTYDDIGLLGKVGGGEITVFPDGTADLEGTADFAVFFCFEVEVEARLNFTESNFFGKVWCKGDPSDPADMSGIRAR